MIGLIIAAATAAANPFCDDRAGDLPVAQCWSRAFNAADVELNAVWPKVRDAARGADRRFRSTPRRDKPSAESDLLKAQRTWLAWRDAECAARSDWAQGGSLQNVIISRCAHDLTRARIDQLQQLLKDFTEP
ncbi:lysozyme inhibitor LprI family protein [Sphingobium sp. CECT 9361]|uniref:lysozyme inhibitor LprI family protein n=1 Tax=Sphingobium sp. CECT 9361 TaxID=2845384 RepID=UPI0033AAA785